MSRLVQGWAHCTLLYNGSNFYVLQWGMYRWSLFCLHLIPEELLHIQLSSTKSVSPHPKILLHARHLALQKGRATVVIRLAADKRRH
jgi:hypothetical protein